MKDRQETTFSTDRLLLRPLEKGDRDAVLEIYSDAETMLYWSSEPISTFGQADEIIENEIKWGAEGNCWNRGIALVESNLLIGKICLFQISEQNRRAEIGYLLNRQHWGKGYMSEAMEFLLAFAFDEMDLHRIEADTDPDNLPSLALLDRFGFVREGYFPDRWFVHGKWHDSVMLGLLEDTYRKNRMDGS